MNYIYLCRHCACVCAGLYFHNLKCMLYITTSSYKYRVKAGDTWLFPEARRPWWISMLSQTPTRLLWRPSFLKLLAESAHKKKTHQQNSWHASLRTLIWGRRVWGTIPASERSPGTRCWTASLDRVTRKLEVQTWKFQLTVLYWHGLSNYGKCSTQKFNSISK